MSATDDEEIPGREVAYRLFAAEYDDASLSYTESDEERAPNYVISPTGARMNRLFAVGTLTEISDVNDEMVRARVVDPTGAFVVYAGQYQPDALAFLEQTTPPAFVAATGKARTFEPEDSDRVYTSVRPESISAVDADTRDRWVVSAAEQTLERIGIYAAAATLDERGEALTAVLEDAGVERALATGIPLAQDHYGTTPSYLAALRDCALEAVAVVAGERDQVSGLDIAPDDQLSADEASFASLADLTSVDLESVATPDQDPEPQSAASVAATPGGDVDSRAGSATPSDTSTAETSSDAALDADAESDEPLADAPTGTLEAESTTSVEDASETSLADESGTADEPVTLEPEDEDEAAASDDDATVDDAVAVDDVADVSTDESVIDEPEDDVTDVDADDFGDGGMYEMDDEEREQLEAEFGAEFTTGAEVEEPGEADIDVPDPDETPESTDEPAPEGESEPETAGDDIGEPPASTLGDDLESAPTSTLEADSEDDLEDTESGDEPTASADDADAASDESDTETDATGEIDLQAHVLETMGVLDDGDGADRTALVERVTAETGAAEADVEDAIQDALMGGQCYEPGDDTLKAI
ncbi:RPA family protein [Natrarchaeobaculum sulfurireducens]|uniref:Glycerol dehydrogenase n=1 Tax=Natrarchaeobaculum sulfurireducens TaxID=2044521 RepID=A0A346PGI7_9EURY|nr:hypothetical protein [Natrarchaeobaculum sulfurireducens]AXR78632.1 hypothetical protein AArc1_2317 [Natrarchaeobaculum sulfurireducens]